MCLGKIRRLMGFLAASPLALAWCADALTLTEVSHSDGAAWYTVPLVSRERKTWQHDAAAPNRVCALEVFHFGVTFAAPSARYGSSEEQDKGFVWELVAQEVDGWNAGTVVAFGPFEVATFPAEEDNVNELLTPHRQDDGSSEMEGMETEKETLECEFDPEFCVLKLVGIRLPDIEDVEGGGSLQIGHSLELEFNQPTNRPNASTKDQIDRVVSFTEYIGSDLVGSWSADGRVLSVRINELDQSQVKPVQEFMQGLLQTSIHVAEARGRHEARKVIAFDGQQSLRIAPPGTYLVRASAIDASVAFHERGKQPLHEMTRLYDSLERDVTIGERGDDDELIQFQKMRADKEGNVAAMAAMGDLYYWGAHGVTRDHAQAYHYFERAAQAGDTGSQSAVAGMLLKGEGAAQDNATAIEWYGKAAEKNHTRALNGLGFIHFHGSGGVSENKSLALEYFERAAANEEDGDSVFNAGYCHATGLGTAVNVTRAMQFYDVAVKMFGHFDAIFEMGKIYMEGVSGIIPRDSGRALPYLKAAAEGGQWGSTMRKAFDLYVNGEFERAVVLYHEARAFTYPVATSNLAFLYDQKLLRSGDEASERQGLKYLYLASEENGDKEVLVRIGDYHYYGLAGLRKDPIVALRWYSRASAEGVDVGAYNVGHMYEFGDGVKANLARAERYYNRVLELSSDSTEIYLVVRFALARLSLRKWLHHTPFEALLGFQSPLTATADTNKSRIDSVLAFDATKTFSGKYYPILTSTLAILAVGIAVRYFQRTR
ncbi:hypothetical protein BBJ28_00000329 [Nothophytophthora sp. Chile5]|nr:hypothetical protein BBJ28_00000329 [Nothophytophthora sp. Chile5]